MVIEDSLTMRALIADTVEEAGDVEVRQAENGFDALRILPREKFDLIITDINMPDINGLEIIHFVKTNPNYRKIPIIIVTTEKSEEDRKKGMALGADAYVTKPFNPEDLIRTVRTHLGPAAKGDST